MSRLAVPWAALLAALVVVAGGAWLQSQVSVGRDVAYYIYNFDLIWRGEKVIGADAPLFLSDLIASNFLLYAPATALTRLGLSPHMATFAYVVALFAPSAVALDHFHRSAGRPMAALATVAAFAAMAFVFPLDMFGQREHIFFLLIVPYVLRSLDRLDSSARRPDQGLLVIGFTTLAVLIKPHYAAVVILVEAVVVLRQRRLLAPLNRVVLIAVSASAVYYLVFMLPLLLDGRHDLAMQLNRVYFSQDLAGLLVRRYSLYWMVFLFAYAVARFTSGETDRSDIWLAAWAGGMAAAIAQWKGVDYHWYPATALAFLGIVQEAAQSRTARRKLILASCALAFILMSASRLEFRLERDAFSARVIDQLSAEMRRYGNGKPFLAPSTDHWPVYPLVAQSGLVHASRFNTLWFFDALAKLEAQGGRVPSGTYQALYDAVLEDTRRYRPRLMVLRDGEDPELSRVLASPAFAEILSHFHEVAFIGGFHLLVREED